MQTDIYVNNIKSYIRGALSKKILTNIETLLSFRVQQADFIPSFIDGRWDGRIKLFDMKDLSFPTGLLNKLLRFLIEENIEYNIIDQRTVSNKQFDWQWVSKDIPKLHDYQEEAVSTAVLSKVGILQLATGAGKTVLMCRIIQVLGRKSLVLVHKLDLLEQARNKIMECLGINVGWIGDGRVEISDVTVGTVQTIVKALGYKYVKFDENEVLTPEKELKEIQKEEIRHFLRNVNVIIIDESHHVRSQTQQDIMNNAINADYRFGLSATPIRDQGDDLLIEGIFGDILCKISATYLISRGFLIPPIIRFNTINHTIFNFFEFVKIDKDGNVFYCDPMVNDKKKGRPKKIDDVWNEIANRNITKIEIEKIRENDFLYEYKDGSKIIRKWNKYDGTTDLVHHIYSKLEEICESVFNDVLLDEMQRDNLHFPKNEKGKQEYEKFLKKMRRKHKDLLMKKKYAFIYDACITDNEYRNMIIAQLVNLHRMKDRSILVLVQRIRHGEKIEKLLFDEVIFLKGEDDIEVRKAVCNRVKKRDLKVLVASTIADEGLDLPALDTVIMAGGGTSKCTALQRVGRAIRLYPGKVKAYIEEFYDDAYYLKVHSRDREEIYRTEPGFEIIKDGETKST